MWKVMVAPNTWRFTLQKKRFGSPYMKLVDGSHLFFTWTVKSGCVAKEEDEIKVYDTELILYNSRVKKFNVKKAFHSHTLNRLVPTTTISRLADLTTIASGNIHMATFMSSS